MQLIAMERQFKELILATTQLLVSAFLQSLGLAIVSSTLHSEKISDSTEGRS